MQKIWLKDSKLSCRQNGGSEKEVKKKALKFSTLLNF